MIFKNKVLLKSIFLEFSIGNNEYKIVRNYRIDNFCFLIKDKFFETEWIKFPINYKKIITQLSLPQKLALKKLQR